MNINSRYVKHATMIKSSMKLMNKIILTTRGINHLAIWMKYNTDYMIAHKHQ